MTKESERKQVRADEASATIRDHDRIAALEREQAIDSAAKVEREVVPEVRRTAWQKFLSFLKGGNS